MIARSLSRAPGYRWVVLLLCWASFTMTSLDRSAWGPAAVAVGEGLGVSLAGLGVFATAYYAGYVISNVAGGALTDRVGARAVLSGSLLVTGGGMLAFGSSRSAGAGIALQGLIGLFAGADYSAGLKLVATWFPGRERGTAVGVYLTATSLGTVIANAVVPRLIGAYDWQLSYRLFGIVSMAVAVACALFLRDGAAGQAGRAVRPDPRPLLADRDLLLLGLAGFGALWGTYGFVTWSNTLMIKGSGVDPVTAGTVVVMFAVVAVVCKPLVGLATDLMGKGRRRPAIGVLLYFVVALLVFGQLRTPAEFLVAAPFLGLGAYLYSPLLVAMVPDLAGVRLAGTAAGAANALWQLGSVTVPVVIGAVFQATDSFGAAFAALAAGPLAGAVLLCFVRDRDPVP
ncbi:MFS transporter [Nonomuraea sp. NPDC023979]|uniref:MFS transporter n=1 Tax=Nonomuraea sp. NPDC023979 TaxID=3154796 RepID=UPI0033E08BFC